MTFKIEQHKWSNNSEKHRSENYRYTRFKVKRGLSIFEMSQRENPQNALDALLKNPSGNGKAIMKFEYKDDVNADYLRALRKGILPHLKELRTKNQKNNSSVWVMEEFGTTGMIGSMKPGEQSNYNDFHFNEGIQSGRGKFAKSKSNGGANQGSIINHLCSNDSAVFTLSSRSDDDIEYLLGKVSYPEHPGQISSGQKKGEYISWNQYLPADEKPITNKEVLKEFVKELNLDRKIGQQDYGTTLVMTNPASGFDDSHSILKAFIENYFIALINDKIEVEVNGIRLDSGNILNEMDKYIDTSRRDYFQFLADAGTRTIGQPDITIDTSWFKKDGNSRSRI